MEIDFALLEEGISYYDQFSYEKMGGDQLLIILPSMHELRNKEISFDQLVDQPILCREQGSSGRKHIENIFESHQAELNIVGECSNALSIMECVHHGMGISMLPEAYVKIILGENDYFLMDVSGKY